MHLAKIPLAIHAILETAAAITFILTPDRQLPGATDEAKLILNSYGGALVTTNILAVLFVARSGFDDESRLVALSLATYHVWPLYRAYRRIRHGIGMEGQQARTAGGPALHFILHSVAGVLLVAAGLF